MMLMRNWFRIVMVLVVVVVIFLIWYFVIGISAGQQGSFYNKGHNAVWLEHRWVEKQSSEAEIQKLVGSLQAHGIDTVFVHSGPFKEDGSIDLETYKFAADFLTKARKFGTDIQYQAWLGQVRGKINLEDENVLKNISVQVRTLTDVVGFDGIHFDIEPVWDGDKAFIEMLKMTREELGEGMIISVALAEFIPSSLLWLTESFHEFENYNSEVNYENVAEYADQIVVMAYDTGLKSEWMYKWLVSEQTVWLTNLLSGKELFIGIPAYDTPSEAFDPDVENVGSALRGVIRGMNNVRSDEENFAGVAIYPYWEIDEDEWGIYDKLWIE